MTRHSACCSPKHTEDKPITAIQKACQSVSHRSLLCSIEQGNLWGKEMSINQLVLVSRETRTVLTASFLKTPKLRKLSIDQGNLWERNSSNAQLRTLLDEQRQMIIAEYCEKVSHHEPLAAQAEQDRRILQGDLLRQQQDFREVHQQDLTEMKELQKFQNSTFDTLTRQKFIEDQNTIMELSGRLQELQNEVNCMNDAEDQAYYQNGGKALPRLGGNGKIPGGITHLRHHRDDGLNTDGGGNLRKSVNGLFTCGMSLTKNLVQKLQSQNSVTANAVYCHRRVV